MRDQRLLVADFNKKALRPGFARFLAQLAKEFTGAFPDVKKGKSESHVGAGLGGKSGRIFAKTEFQLGLFPGSRTSAGFLETGPFKNQKGRRRKSYPGPNTGGKSPGGSVVVAEMLGRNPKDAARCRHKNGMRSHPKPTSPQARGKNKGKSDKQNQKKGWAAFSFKNLHFRGNSAICQIDRVGPAQ